MRINEVLTEYGSIHKNLVAFLKQEGFLGPFPLSKFPELYADIKNIAADDDPIMIRGNDIDHDPWVVKGDYYGYIYGQEIGYQIGLTGAQVKRQVIDDREPVDEVLSRNDLNDVERFADALWGKLNIDVEFTRHFFDRVNDMRNKKPISAAELIRLFKKAYQKYGKQLADQEHIEAVMKDLLTQINLPFVLKDKGDEKQLVAKTVMRKPNFKTSNQTYEI